MASVYTRAATLVIPAIRASLANVLLRKYGMKEESIADALGITQAAVSKYVSGSYSARIKAFQKSVDGNAIAESAAKIAKDPSVAAACVCDLCNKINGSKCYFREGGRSA